MKASDYIVEFLIENGITDVFGYPGGMISYLLDSFKKYSDKITAHISYNEQGAAIAACGYAQTSGKVGVAYSSSGPGATNMITGICNAYMDSIPTVFITGQVNSYEQKGDLQVRQRGFQETDIVAMVSNVTKYAAQVNSALELRWYLEYAFFRANEGRKGPVLLDIAMDVTRADICPEKLRGYAPNASEKSKKKLTVREIEEIKKVLQNAERPVVLLGNGIQRNTDTIELLKSLDELNIPVVSSMIAVDVHSYVKNFYGFIGAYGDRTANFIVAKSDMVLSIGARLDVRQVGAKREDFAPGASIIRIDIDSNELKYKVHEDEYGYCADAGSALQDIVSIWKICVNDNAAWMRICNEIFDKLHNYDDEEYNEWVRCISSLIPDNSVVTTDVGQNQVWVAQSFSIKSNQRILFSGGLGAMGFSLPAAIGASIALKKPVYCFNGDGGIQMNIQELQVIAREHLPIKIFIFNNNALGMIRHFQEMYFESNYFQTTSQSGFTSPIFQKLAEAYELKYVLLQSINQIEQIREDLYDNYPIIIEVSIVGNTYVFPKLEFGKPNQDQEPLLDRKLYNELMELGEDAMKRKNAEISGGGINRSVQYVFRQEACAA